MLDPIGIDKSFSKRKRTSCLPLLNRVFERWNSKTSIRQQTECPPINRLSYLESNKNLNSIAPPYEQRAFSLLNPADGWLSHHALAIYMFVLLISMLWHRQAIFESKENWLSSSTECRIRTWKSHTYICQHTECPFTNRLSYRGSS